MLSRGSSSGRFPRRRIPALSQLGASDPPQVGLAQPISAVAGAPVSGIGLLAGVGTPWVRPIFAGRMESHGRPIRTSQLPRGHNCHPVRYPLNRIQSARRPLQASTVPLAGGALEPTNSVRNRPPIVTTRPLHEMTHGQTDRRCSHWTMVSVVSLFLAGRDICGGQ